MRLNRIIGSHRLDYIDPFVLLDELKSDNPGDYIAGFPSHPHRGIETITYMIAGRFRHQDSKGGGGLLGPGCVQWMTAGRGIVHSEMPEMREGLLWGYQLWLSLATIDKLIEPRYQHLNPEDMPTLERQGLRVKLISGDYEGLQGAAKTWFPVTYFDVRLSSGSEFSIARSKQSSSFFYVHSGSVQVESAAGPRSVSAGELAVLGQGDRISISEAGSDEPGPSEVSPGEAGFLFFAGVPHNEPIVRGGPFVMNSEEEIRQAFLDYQTGKLFR